MASPEELMLRDLRARYVALDITPQYERLYLEADPNGRMFAYWQMRLVELFSFMNAKAGRGGHFNADESRELLHVIEMIQEARDTLQLLGSDITIDGDYQRALDESATFLSPSGGSDIPLGFTPIEVRKWKYQPLFSASDTEIRLPERGDSAQLKMVAEGAFAFVYTYVDPLYELPVAIKRAKPGIAEKDFQRFRIEFDLLKSINHPNILQVYKFDEEKRQYTMEYCDATLRSYIRGNNARLKFGTRKRVALQFLYGINHLHGRKHLHRDISLQNVLVKTYDGGAVVVKVSDFGLLKEHGSTLTRTESELRGTILDPTIKLPGRRVGLHYEKGLRCDVGHDQGVEGVTA